MVSTETNVTFTRQSQEKQFFSSFLDPSLSTKVANITAPFTSRENMHVDTRNEDTGTGTTQEVVGSGSKYNGKLRRQPVDIKAERCSCC